jgi:hypothetical protein
MQHTIKALSQASDILLRSSALIIFIAEKTLSIDAVATGSSNAKSIR